MLFKSNNNIKPIAFFILFVYGDGNVNPTFVWGSHKICLSFHLEQSSFYLFIEIAPNIENMGKVSD